MAAVNGAGFAVAAGAAAAAAKPAKKKAEPKKAEAPKEEKKAAPKKAALKKAAKSEGDDLTQISGVGPVIVKKLHDLGVTTFAQIAAWTPEDVAAMDRNWFSRIDRDEWLKQAAEL